MSAAANSDWEASLTIVIPAYNEEKSIEGTIRRLHTRLPASEVIIVDDGSSDNTAAEASKVAGVIILRHGSNRGYGAALKTGMMKSSRSYIAWFDADGEHRVDDLVAMARSLHDRRVSAVLGQRLRRRGSLVHLVGKWFLHSLTRSLSRNRIYDLNCGLRVFRREAIYPYLRMLPSGFSASLTSTIVLLERGHSIELHPITLAPRIGNSKVSLSDGFSSLALVLRIIMLFAPLRIFVRLGLACIFTGAAYSIALALIRGEGVPVAGATGILAGLIFIALGLIADQISQIRLSLLDETVDLRESRTDKQ